MSRYDDSFLLSRCEYLNALSIGKTYSFKIQTQNTSIKMRAQNRFEQSFKKGALVTPFPILLSPQWSFYANPSGPTSHIANQDVRSKTLKMLCQMCLKVTRPVFAGHWALTNADEANEIQQNVVTAKKGKKRGIKAILHRSR